MRLKDNSLIRVTRRRGANLAVVMVYHAAGSSARGERSKEIAGRLGLTRRTIETYLTSIHQKLEVDSRAAAVAVALEQGLLKKKS